MARPCIGCGTASSKLTDEHSPPLWTTAVALKRLPDLMRGSIEQDRHGKVIPKGHFSDVVNGICEPCRKHVNDTIDHPAHRLVEPILFGDPTIISASDVPLVAAWFAYESMVRAIPSRDHAFGTFPAEDLQFLVANGRLPPSHVIWIGCRANLTVQLRPPRPRRWSHTSGINGVYSAMFMVAMRHQYGTADPSTAHHDGEDYGALIRLWPRTAGFSWPPSTYLTNLTIASV